MFEGTKRIKEGDKSNSNKAIPINGESIIIVVVILVNKQYI